MPTQTGINSKKICHPKVWLLNQWLTGVGKDPGFPALSHPSLEQAVSTGGHRLTGAAGKGILPGYSNIQRQSRGAFIPVSSSQEGFPDSSFGKEFACNAGDPSWIPELGRSAGEGIGYPLQYSWASLVAQLVKNPSAMGETCV